MLKYAYFIESINHNPHHNLSLEEALFDNLPEDSIIFYLWQNQHTVVIGKNQNAHKECDLQKIKEDACILARRSTGGGAVYHDLGNLNFSFITSEEFYSLERQSSVILDCLQQFSVQAKLNGRNDIEVDGKKISGNAYLTRDKKKLHHGTLMVHVDTEIMKKYLRPSKLKLQAKGVNSIRSRVINLKDLNPFITVPQIKNSLKIAFENIYQLPLLPLEIPANYNEYYQHYQSEKFIYGSLSNYTHYLEYRFDFGEVNVYYTLKNNKIIHIVSYSDAMDLSIVHNINHFFKGLYLDYNEFQARFQVSNQDYLKELYFMMEEKKNEL